MKKKTIIISFVGVVSLCVIASVILFYGKQDYTMRCEEIKCNSKRCPRFLFRCANSEAVCYRYDPGTYSETETFCFKK